MSRFAGFDHAFVATGFACATACVAARASAEGGARPVRMDYEAPSSCPDSAAFERQLRARSARIAVAPDARTSVRVRIAPRGGQFEGSVALEEPGGADTTRRVDGLCPDVVAALSLIAAVALDPMASTASDPLAPTATANVAPPKPEPAAPPKQDAPPVPPPSPPLPREPPAVEAGSPGRDADVPGTSVHHPWRWSIGAGVGVAGGVVPDLAVSLLAYVDLARWTRDVVAPSFRLRFDRASSDGSSGADFLWTVGSFDACPVAISSASFRVWPCARIEAGALEATGDIGAARTRTRPWVSAGALARARWVIVGALFVEVEAGGTAPIVRDRFFLEPDQTVHRAPVLAAAGSSSVGASFW